MHSLDEVTKALSTISRVEVYGPWARVLALHHLEGPPPGAAAGSPPQPLWGGGAAMTGARFTPKGTFSSLYLASNPITALAEVGAVFEVGDQFIYHDHVPYGVFCVQGLLTDVLDLTDPVVQARLGATDQELRGPWRRAQARAMKSGGPLPVTQQLGEAAYRSGLFGGIRFPSAKIEGPFADGINLVAFTDRLGMGPIRGTFTLDTPTGRYAQRLP